MKKLISIFSLIITIISCIKIFHVSASAFSDLTLKMVNQTYISIPTQVFKGDDINLTIKIENISTQNENPADHHDYKINKCMVLSNFIDDRDRSKPALDYIDGYFTLHDGTNVGFVKLPTATMPGISVDITGTSPVIVPKGQSITAQVNLSTSSDAVKETDEVYVTFSCGFEDENQIGMGPGMPSSPPHILIKPKPQSDPTPAPTPAPAPAPDPVSEPAQEEIIAVPLSIEPVQETLRLNIQENTDLANVEAFEILNEGYGKIVFHNSLNLDSEEIVEKFNRINDFVTVGNGVIELDSGSLTQLADQPATLTMTGLNFSKTPRILVNGEEDSDEIVTNINYDSENGVLIFDVKHFTKFEAVENTDDSTNQILQTPEDNQSELENFLTENSVVAAFGVGVVLTAALLLTMVIRKRLKDRNNKETDSKAIDPKIDS